MRELSTLNRSASSNSVAASMNLNGTNETCVIDSVQSRSRNKRDRIDGDITARFWLQEGRTMSALNQIDLQSNSLVATTKNGQRRASEWQNIVNRPLDNTAVDDHMIRRAHTETTTACTNAKFEVDSFQVGAVADRGGYDDCLVEIGGLGRLAGFETGDIDLKAKRRC
jgi:hypothetical protein